MKPSGSIQYFTARSGTVSVVIVKTSYSACRDARTPQRFDAEVETKALPLYRLYCTQILRITEKKLAQLISFSVIYRITFALMVEYWQSLGTKAGSNIRQAREDAANGRHWNTYGDLLARLDSIVQRYGVRASEVLRYFT